MAAQRYGYIRRDGQFLYAGVVVQYATRRAYLYPLGEGRRMQHYACAEYGAVGVDRACPAGYQFCKPARQPLDKQRNRAHGKRQQERRFFLLLHLRMFGLRVQSLPHRQ